MRFNISKSAFNSALNLVSRAIAINSPLPALSGIKLETLEDQLVLIASDTDLSIKKILKVTEEKNSLEILESGAIVLEGRYLLDIVRKMDSDIIHFEIVDGTLVKISGHSAHFNLNGMRAQSYPQIDFTTPELQFKMPADELGNIINQTLFATSDKETRPVLTGINFNYNKEELLVVATDSYRLARKHVPLTIIDEPFNATIPRKVLGEILKVLDEEEHILVAISNNKVQFINDHNVIQSSLLDGIYPETNRLIPNQFIAQMTISSRDMLNAIDRASFIKSDGISIVRLNMSEEKVEMSSKSQEVGSSLEVLNPTSYQGDKLTLSFSGKFMTDAIRALNSSEVLIQFSGEMKPFIITTSSDESIIQLVLPVRTYD